MPDSATNAASPLPPPYFESADQRFRLYQGDCLDLMPRMPPETFDLIFADPPYFLSNDGITCHAGKMVSVNKGKWDQSKGAEADHEFTLRWLAECRRLLKPNGSIWVSGTMHIIHSVGYAMQRLGFRILNDITWVKPNPPPNLSCRYFTHATETILWAGRDRKCKHKFNYALMRRLNCGKQMQSVWTIQAPRREEKVFGKHPTQKPVALLERIIAASSDENDLVLDPFSGSGTTGIAAARMRRAYTGLDADSAYLLLSVFRFVGVPQADSPEKLLALLQTLKAGETALPDLATLLQVTERQAQYYSHAASLLGFAMPYAGKWTLTARGAAVCGSQSPQAALSRIMLEHPLVRLAERKAEGAKGHQEQQAAVARLLQGCTCLADTTCMRRAQTLLAWLSWARGFASASAGVPIGTDLSANGQIL
jgi:site-specific DNA-methyltransferase (adenine-specific)